MENSSMKHIISTKNLADRDLLDMLFVSADRFANEDATKKFSLPLTGKLLATIFYEPSTRTRFSFEAAMYKLGGQVLTSESAGQFSSASKGETLTDAIQVIGGYADAIVLRHPEKGSAARAATASPVAILNAGDGAGEHPTQALLDLYTITKEHGTVDGLTFAFVGDLLHGRTVHSLLSLIALYSPKKIYLVSPSQLKLPDEYKQGLTTEEALDLKRIAPDVDVMYVTRVQKERFATQEEYDAVKNSYVVDKALLTLMKQSARILHPLPRVTEIDPEIDIDPRAAYFRQAKNGLYARMALLNYVINE
jgi:aspartate carbamoyltransferase catalytic subunit